MLQAGICRETAVTDPNDLRTKGERTRTRVLGASHVARAKARSGAFDAPFQELLTDAAWGHVWSRPDIPARERSMITIALLAALGHWNELAMHVRATRNTGASPEDIREALLHVAIYAGIPAANRAFEVARDALAELSAPAEEGENP
ncbi:MAG: 4-carboxymuconolactone decarboxylase [Alphaproteobacteria bacterium]|nr:MAG: 4-carboxymuconolactone decarboxylase [Alphaproteobacteria bacterium]